MKAMLAILGVFFLFMCLGGVMLATHHARTDNLTETFALDTAVGVNTTNVTLGADLWENSVAFANVASNESGDTPGTNAYYSATRQLEINGLAADSTRTLTVDYETEGLADYPGAADAITLMPTAYVVALIALPVIVVVFAIANRMR